MSNLNPFRIMPPAPRQLTRILPRSVAVLGEMSLCCVYDKERDEYYEIPPKKGAVLCSSPDGRRLFILVPHERSNKKVKTNALTIEAVDLYEKFMGKPSRGVYSLVVPGLRKPEYAGELVFVRYIADKAKSLFDETEPEEEFDDSDTEDDDTDGTEDDDDDDDDVDRELLPTLDDSLSPDVVEWEHYFEDNRQRPAYPELWDLGCGQFHVPEGKYKVKPEGIAFYS